jgi:biopolymer transport protein TolR
MAMDVAATKGKKGFVNPSINVTPLVDIVLVVLIIFMLITPMMTKTFWMNLPPKDDEKKEQAAPPPTEIKPVVMTVDAGGVIRVNNVVFAKGEIQQRLPRVLAGAGQRVLYFDAADAAPYSAAVEAMDLSRASGVRSIALLTDKVAK